MALWAVVRGKSRLDVETIVQVRPGTGIALLNSDLGCLYFHLLRFPLALHENVGILLARRSPATIEDIKSATKRVVTILFTLLRL